MIFSRDQAAQIRQGKITAAPIPATQTPPRPGTTTPLWRRVQHHDQDGNPEGNPTPEIVYDGTLDDRKPVRLTILDVDENMLVSAINESTARACGYRTSRALRDAWAAQPWHRRRWSLARAHVVRFAHGDIRDHTRLLNRTGTAGGDYTSRRARSIDPDAEAVRPDELNRLAKQARERDLKRRNDPGQKLRDQLTSELDRLEHEAATKDVAASIRRIRRELAVLDRKLKAA